MLKNRAPVNKEVLRVTLPKPKEADLSNGVHLLVLEDHRTPQINFSMIIDGAGGYYDPPAVPGLASFVASLMREGTTTKTSEQISEQLDRLAAAVNVRRRPLLAVRDGQRQRARPTISTRCSR